MGLTRMPRRAVARKNHRPNVETLEVRTLLSTGTGNVQPRLSGPPVLAAGGLASGSNSSFDPIIGASAARSTYQVDGSGLTVAVIDAGVNYNHSALGDGFGTGHKVVGGWDFAGNDPNPIPSGLEHGTAVAGLIASNDPTYPGVAPGADIVALRIFDDANQSSFDRVADALQWVVDHHDDYHITVVNLSLSDGRNYAQNWYANDGGVGQRVTDLVSKLDAINIPVVTATGNSFDGKEQGAGFTGIIADSISVTATDASDHLVSNAQRLGKALGGASATNLAAPGDGLTAPGDGSSFSTVSGTSFSAPLVSGAVVLLQQLYESRYNKLPSVSDVEGWLENGSDPVFDPSTGITIGRLDIPKALSLVPTPASALQVLTPPSTPTTALQVLTPPSAPSSPPVAAPAPPVLSTPSTPVQDSPPPAPTPPPSAPETAPTTPAVTTTTDVSLNGQVVKPTDLDASDSAAKALPTFFQKVLRSLRGWWTDPKSRLRVWASNPTKAEWVAPAGIVKKIPMNVASASRTQSQASARMAKPVRPQSKPAGLSPPPAMARAWHGKTFVAGLRGR